MENSHVWIKHLPTKTYSTLPVASVFSANLSVWSIQDHPKVGKSEASLSDSYSIATCQSPGPQSSPTARKCPENKKKLLGMTLIVTNSSNMFQLIISPMYIRVYIYIYHTHVCVSVCVICIYIYVCIHIYIYINDYKCIYITLSLCMV